MKGAQMAGINTAVVKISVFVIAGALVGIGAFLWIAMNASADPATTGNSYEMYAIAKKSPWWNQYVGWKRKMSGNSVWCNVLYDY